MMTHELKNNKRIPLVEYYLRKFVEGNHRIIDIGCGTAQYRHSTSAIYIGLDLTREPYSENRPRDVDVVGSGMYIPMAHHTYDLVFTVGALYQMADPYKALMEFLRILKPNGRVMLFEYNRRAQKRLQIGEAQKRPCWTQWGLKRLVQRSGFRSCELLLPICYEVGKVEKFLRLIRQECLGQWAIVTGLRGGLSPCESCGTKCTEAGPLYLQRSE